MRERKSRPSRNHRNTQGEIGHRLRNARLRCKDCSHFSSLPLSDVVTRLIKSRRERVATAAESSRRRRSKFKSSDEAWSKITNCPDDCRLHSKSSLGPCKPHSNGSTNPKPIENIATCTRRLHRYLRARLVVMVINLA